MPELKIDLGRKPELSEVRVFGKALAGAGEKKLVEDVEKYKAVEKEQGDARDAALVAIGMSFCMNKTGEMITKFVDEGKIENPLNTSDVMKEAIKKADLKKDESLDEKIEKALNQKDDEEKEYSEDDIEFAHKTIDQAYKKAAIELMNKYGKTATIKFLSAYAESFLCMVEGWAKEEEEEEFDPEDIKKNGKEISIEELFEDLKENGHEDMIEKVKGLMDGDTEVRVFKCKVEKKKKD